MSALHHRTMLAWAAAHASAELAGAIDRLLWKQRRVVLSAHEEEDLHYLIQERGNRCGA